MRSKEIISAYHEDKHFTTVKLHKLGMKYMDEFLRLKCSPDLLLLKLFPNSKEVTESFGAYDAVRKYLQDQFSLDDPKVNCFVVGDGTRPRTGATFAFRTAWNVVSIDPGLKHSDVTIDRLRTIAKHIQDCSFISYGRALIVAVHSHASLKESVRVINAPEKWIISMPCCREDDLGIKPEISYYDWNIWSEKRLVNIYKI